jgi:branched-chain amino acid transport system permease protein
MNARNLILFAIMATLIFAVAELQSWNTALITLNMGLISAIMAMGVNLQWGYAGLFNTGIMGFVALGGLAAVLTSMPPTTDAWSAGGLRMMSALICGLATIIAATLVWKSKLPHKGKLVAAMLVGGFFLYRFIFDPAAIAIEAVNPAGTGYLGGLGLPVLISWPMGALFAAAAAWVIGKTALGLRSDYLAIATLGIAEIIASVMKNEDWLDRGPKNVTDIPRPVHYEIDLQSSNWFLEMCANWGWDPITASTILVKLEWAVLITLVLLLLILMAELALKSPWGRMMRAIRDNEEAAEAMGKDVTGRHLQIFILGSAVCGLAGAMMTSLDGLLALGSYTPLRFTFLIWVMAIVGGSGNNWGALIGGLLVWFFWAQAEPMGKAVMDLVTAPMEDGSWLKVHLIDSVAHMRVIAMGALLLLVLRFAPRGLIPEK